METKNTPEMDILKELAETGINDAKVETSEDALDNIGEVHVSEDTCFDTEHNQQENSKKIENKYIASALFMGKYILTTALIFGVLLVATNYDAYYNIAKSYVYAEEYERQSKSIISSVQASNIKEKYKEEIKDQKRRIEKDKSNTMAEHSIGKLVSVVNKEDVAMDIEITPYENRVIIPKIGKNIPLVDIKNRSISGSEELNDIFMKELEKGIIRYPGSAKPGEDGNSFIFGHSSNFPWIKGEYNAVFALLDNVEYDDDVIIYYNQKKYIYKIREKKVITPGDISVLERNHDKPEISLMTCWPIGTTLNRLIVTGELVDVTDEEA